MTIELTDEERSLLLDALSALSRSGGGDGDEDMIESLYERIARG